MSFSDSFAIGDNTFQELEKGFIVKTPKMSTDLITPPSRKRRLSKGNPTSDTNTYRTDLDDVIEESPTDKSNLTNKTIKERLRNTSAKKRNFNRSKSDPITPKAKEQSISSTSIDDFGSMFNSTMDTEPPAMTRNVNNNGHTMRNASKTNISNDKNMFSESIGEYFQDSMDCFTQLREIDKENRPQPQPSSNAGQSMRHGLNENMSQFFRSQFTLETLDADNNTSGLNGMLRTQSNLLPALNDLSENVANENYEPRQGQISFHDTDDIPIVLQATDRLADLLPTTQNMSRIHWDESDFFNDFDIRSQQNVPIDQQASEITHENENVLLDGTIREDLNASIADFFNDEMENCKLDVSSALREVPQSQMPMVASTQYARTADKPELIDSEETDIRDMKNLSNWGFSRFILEEYKKKGIAKMFDWQAECLNNVEVRNGAHNLVYSAPTSAGKTFVSEILMIRNVIKRQKKVLVILPFISVVREKMCYLQDLLRSSGIRVEGFFGGHSPPGGFDMVDIAVCTIEKANSIINKLLQQMKLDSIGVIVVDEIHLISDPGRGYILELLLTKAMFCSKKLGTDIQIVAMSATLPNAELLTKWLQAVFYRTDYRPVELKEMIKIGNKIYDRNMDLIRTIDSSEYVLFQNDQDNVGQLSIETIMEGSAVIIFCPSKDWCESLAMHVAAYIYKIGKSKTELSDRLRTNINMALIENVKSHLKNCPTGLDAVLEKVISYGVAFHHAGLTIDERDIIESAFSNGSVRVIVATSTLSSGVNLPARRVIIRTPMFAGKPMSSITYKQMIGRAGRTGKDTIGESILICSDNNVNAGKDLICAELKPLSSCLKSDNSAHLKRAILEIIAAGMAVTKCDLEAFIKSTLLYSETNFEIKYFARDSSTERGRKTRIKHTPTNDTGDPIEECMIFLEEYEFIRLQFNEETQEMSYIATRLGHACLASSIPPSEGFLLFSELQKARQCFVMESELHAVYLVTPFSVCYQLQEIDWLSYLDMWEKLSSSMRQIGTLVGVKESFLVKAMRGSTTLDYRMLQIHKRFYTALALMELVDEIPINTVAMKYKFSRGVLQSLQQMTSTFAGVVTAFCRALNWGMLELIIAQFQERLFFGVHQDLIDLMKISILNSQRARALHSAGLTTLIDVANANLFAIEHCLHDAISFDSKKRDGESDYDAEQRNKQRSLFVTGKSGLSVKEAAAMIVLEARAHLETEMRINNVNWAKLEPREINNEESEKTDPIVNNGVPNGAVPIVASHSEHTPNMEVVNQNEPCDAISVSGTEIHAHVLQQHAPGTDREDESNDIISFSDAANSAGTQEHLINTSHLLNDSKSETEAATFTHINIIDVFKQKLFFSKFEEELSNVAECSLSLAVEKLDPSIKKHSERCAIGDGVYIGGLAICIGSNVAFYLDLKDDKDSEVSWAQRVCFLKKLLMRKELTLKILDAKDQLKALLRGIPEAGSVSCALEDPKVAHWLLQPDAESTLLRMALAYAPECVALTKSISNVKSAVVNPRYRASVEACSALHILHGQIQNLKRMNNEILKSFREMEMPIQKSLLLMEITGIAVNHHLIENLNLEITDHMRQLEQDMHALNGSTFRFYSRQEIARILRIPHANPNTKISRDEIEKSDHPIAKLLLQHRSLSAILSKTIQPLMKTIVGNRIYGTNVSFTSTGRITMHEPNLQTVAKDFDMEFLDSERNRTLSCRRVFEAESGRLLISADFCQLELRVLAHLSNDRSLIDIFKTQEDVFVAIAAKWNKVPATSVTEKLRDNVKQICYGIIYGMGTKSLSTAMKCDEAEASNLSESFHKAYPGIRNYTDQTIDFARRNGYVETLAGRRRYLPHISTTDVANRKRAERQAINTRIQGSAADIAKMAMLRMERNIRKYQDRIKINVPDTPLSWVHLVLHLHDELIYEVPADRGSNVAKILKSSMENCAQLNVPLEVKLKTGISWGSMEAQ